jgi:competence protein ComEC
MPLFWLALAFLGGILLADTVSMPTGTWLILAGLALGGSILLSMASHWLARRVSAHSIHPRLPAPFSPTFAALLLTAIFTGASRYQAVQPDFYDPGFIAWYNQVQGTVILEGVIVQPPDVRDTYTNLRLAVDKIRLASDSTFLFHPVHGLLLVRASPGEIWQYGDRVHLEGLLEDPPEGEGFSYREYLARQGIYSYMGRASLRFLRRNQGNPILAAIYRFKANALVTVYRILPDPEASLAAGILLGVEIGIPQEVQEAFKITGTSHIIAISGLTKIKFNG